MNKDRLIIGITGASSVIYGARLLEHLKALDLVETHLVLSGGASETLRLETNKEPQEVRALADQVWEEMDFTAPISSGSYQTLGMIILPCSMKTLAAVSHGYDDNLLSRAAGVQLKERRKLVLCPRETPMHSVHLQNMLTLSQMGTIILPCVPAFYHQPLSIEDLMDHSIGKILDQFKLEHQLYRRWREK